VNWHTVNGNCALLFCMCIHASVSEFHLRTFVNIDF